MRGFSVSYQVNPDSRAIFLPANFSRMSRSASEMSNSKRVPSVAATVTGALFRNTAPGRRSQAIRADRLAGSSPSSAETNRKTSPCRHMKASTALVVNGDRRRMGSVNIVMVPFPVYFTRKPYSNAFGAILRSRARFALPSSFRSGSYTGSSLRPDSSPLAFVPWNRAEMS